MQPCGHSGYYDDDSVFLDTPAQILGYQLINTDAQHKLDHGSEVRSLPLRLPHAH